MKKWKLLFILIIITGSVIGQNLDTLQVKCIKTMTLVIPQSHMDTLFNYEEGFFKTFYWRNGDIVDIQCGSMSESVYLNDTLRFEQYQTC